MQRRLTRLLSICLGSIGSFVAGRWNLLSQSLFVLGMVFNGFHIFSLKAYISIIIMKTLTIVTIIIYNNNNQKKNHNNYLYIYILYINTCVWICRYIVSLFWRRLGDGYPLPIELFGSIWKIRFRLRCRKYGRNFQEQLRLGGTSNVFPNGWMMFACEAIRCIHYIPSVS